MSKLKQLREQAGLSQTQLGDKASVSYRMIQHYEQGIKDINKAQALTVYKLAKALQVQIEDILEL